MKAALLSKAALCVCPPAIVAASVATVPPIRKAVHHATRPAAAAKPAPKRHTVAKQTAAARPALPPCPPLPAALTEPVQALTFAEPVPAEPSSTLQPFATTTPGGGTPVNGGITPIVSGFTPGGGGGGGTPPGGNPDNPGTPVTPGNPNEPPVPVVPEPASWMLMIAGFGAMGALLRRRKTAEANGRSRGRGRHKLAGVAAAADALVPIEAMGSGSAAVGSTKAALLAKAALCVCPPALMAVTAATVPPVRQAVYRATAPATPVLRSVTTAAPCDPTITAANGAAPTLLVKPAPAPAAASKAP